MTRALVCSGGGALGAWQGGAIQALTDQGVAWTHFAGVSVGALNASYMSQFEAPFQHQQFAAKGLKQLWFDVKGNDDVYKAHAPGFLKWIWQFWKRSLYSMKPLEDMVQRSFIPNKVDKAGNKLWVGVTNLNLGTYEAIRINKNFSRKDAAAVIHASSVFPGLFEPVALNSADLYIDGGVRNTIPILDILSEDVDEVDVILTSPRAHFKTNRSFKSAIDVGLHAANIMAHEVYVTDLQVVCEQKHGIKLNIYEPPDDLREDPFEFDPKAIREMWFKGYQQTTRKGQ